MLTHQSDWYCRFSSIRNRPQCMGDHSTVDVHWLWYIIVSSRRYHCNVHNSNMATSGLDRVFISRAGEIKKRHTVHHAAGSMTCPFFRDPFSISFVCANQPCMLESIRFECTASFCAFQLQKAGVDISTELNLVPVQLRHRLSAFTA